MSRLVVFDNGMRRIDTQYANITTDGNLRVTGFHSEGNITLPAKFIYLY